MKKPDLDSREQIKRMVDSFYEKVREEDQLRFVFETISSINWESHLPKMYSFWESILLNGHSYSGNPMQVHKDIHHKHPLEKQLFDQWITLFTSNVKQQFEGPKAEMAISRAENIARIMQHVINT
ncbi:MAG TPA: group III truncated hemoglobin [Bacteroidia bacterium]|nr:group III truncated hemoglobin [Bacteroidia bacterium]HNT80811.1 group III truncated hemoglobin [Bacteroidia bacterium]